MIQIYYYHTLENISIIQFILTLMISFRELLKQTWKIVPSPSLRSYLLLCYKNNPHVPISSPFVSDWVLLLKEIACQQTESRPKVAFTNKIHHFESCGIGFKGFQFDSARLSAKVQSKKREELLDFFMFAQLQYLEWKLGLERKGRNKKKGKSLVFAVRKGYENTKFRV